MARENARDRGPEGNPTIDSLLLLPLDERPINSVYPRLLAAALGWQLEAPDHLLGSRKRPADAAAIAEWLTTAAGAAPRVGAVLALDTLAWGGLIPSRQSGNDLQAALARLGALRDLKAAQPSLPLLAYSSIQRVSRDDDDGEEPTYYRTYGRAIFRRSVLEHRAAAGALEGDEAHELERLREQVPAEVWDDQLQIRERTAAVNFAALDLVEEGVIDTLVFNQDDTTVWGVNVMHRQRLEREVKARGLGGRVLVYPGADEVAQVLIARLGAMARGMRPRVAALYSSRGGADVQTAYEDRPLGDLLSVHVRAAGGVCVPPGVAPDLWVALNSPSRAQGQGGTSHALAFGRANPGTLGEQETEWLERSEASVDGLDRSLESFRNTLCELLDAGALVSVADVAHVNGADDELMSGLAADGALPRLGGYGGWNTAGNALGSAVALGSIAALGGDLAALELAIAARFVDDWLYQARVRTRLLLTKELRPLGLGGFVPEADLPAVAERARELVNDELRAFGLPYRVTRLALPWQRVFEIDYDLERVPDGGAA